IGIAYNKRRQINTHRRCDGLKGSQLPYARSCAVARKNSDARDARLDLFEQFKPFDADAVLRESKAGNVAARMRQGRDQTTADRVGNSRESDRDRATYAP